MENTMRKYKTSYIYIVRIFLFTIIYSLLLPDAADAESNPDTTSPDITFPMDEKLFDSAFKTDTGEIYGFIAEKKLYFFRFKSREGCFSQLLNTAIDTETCEMMIPSKESSLIYEHNSCIDIHPDYMFRDRVFFHQFKNKPNKYYGTLHRYLFTTSSPEIAHCFKK